MADVYFRFSSHFRFHEFVSLHIVQFLLKPLMLFIASFRYNETNISRLQQGLSKQCPPKHANNFFFFKKKKKLCFWRQFFSSSLGCLCLSSRSHSSSPSWKIVVVEKMRFFSSHSFLLFLPTTIALPLPETRSSAADIARRTNYNFARTYKLVFAPNLPVSRRKEGADHQFAVKGANKKR